jgi:hypothetical protein
VAAQARRAALRRAVRPRLVRDQRLRLPVAALVAAGWALGVGLLVCVVGAVLAWTVGGHGAAGFGDALRSGGLAFVAAHLAPVSIGGTTISLLPLGLLALPALLTYRAGRWAARATYCTTLHDAARLTGIAAGGYVVGAVLVAALSSTGAGAVALPYAALATALVSVLGLGCGAVSSAGLWPAVLEPVPIEVRRGVRAAAVVLAALLAGATLALVVTLALHAGAIASLTAQVAPGAAAAVLLVVLCVLYLPTLLVWSLAYLTGTGIVLGGATITPFSGGGGLVPAFPLLAAIPDHPAALAPLLLVVPVAAGVLGGVILVRGGGRTRGDLPVAETLTAAGVTGLASAGLALLGSGALGADRLAHVGPNAWLVGPSVFALVLLGMAPAVLLGGVVAGRAGRSAQRTPSVVVDLREPGPPAPDPLGAPAPGADDADSGTEAASGPPADAPAAASALARAWHRIRPLLHSDGSPE